LNASNPIYVQYGCGLSCPDGWINFDASPTLRLQRLPSIGRLFRSDATVFPAGVRYGDIVKGLPVANASVQGIYASHVLEHLSYADFWTALDNTFRLLRPGGIFRLVVPDLEARAQKYIREVELGHAEANAWLMRTTGLGQEHRPRTLKALLGGMFGGSRHLWMWDQQSLAAALEKTGFDSIRRCRFGDCDDEAFRSVENPDRFYDSNAGIEECAMQATKPHEVRDVAG
jgi:SAM-dependent methyltransferase